MFGSTATLPEKMDDGERKRHLSYVPAEEQLPTDLEHVEVHRIMFQLGSPDVLAPEYRLRLARQLCGLLVVPERYLTEVLEYDIPAVVARLLLDPSVEPAVTHYALWSMDNLLAASAPLPTLCLQQPGLLARLAQLLQSPSVAIRLVAATALGNSVVEGTGPQLVALSVPTRLAGLADGKGLNEAATRDVAWSMATFGVPGVAVETVLSLLPGLARLLAVSDPVTRLEALRGVRRLLTHAEAAEPVYHEYLQQRIPGLVLACLEGQLTSPNVAVLDQVAAFAQVAIARGQLYAESLAGVFRHWHVVLEHCQDRSRQLALQALADMVALDRRWVTPRIASLITSVLHSQEPYDVRYDALSVFLAWLVRPGHSAYTITQMDAILWPTYGLFAEVLDLTGPLRAGWVREIVNRLSELLTWLSQQSSDRLRRALELMDQHGFRARLREYCEGPGPQIDDIIEPLQTVAGQYAGLLAHLAAAENEEEEKEHGP